MFIKYYKGKPNTHVIAYRNGIIHKQGRGITLWYSPFNTTIAAVPVMTQDAPFIFHEITANYQEIAVQGQLTYRLENPVLAAEQHDFSIHTGSGRYLNKDPEKLVQRIINTIQALTRTQVNQMDLETAIREVKAIAARVLENLKAEEDLRALGVAIENLHITAIKPNPEMQKALEADYREGLQKRADQAIYDRRAAAQVEEDKLKRNEMETEVALEDRRKDLVNMQAENQLTLAEAEAKGEEMKLNPYGELGPQALLALALKEWAANTGQIGTLNINPDLLGQLVKWTGQGDANHG
ncbi:MAG: hypothetical protein GWM98_02435 [Nitrospinaceae bacterium]|nr:SPFH domain-containing protein [Nitrospinaceae bacterium]NIR53564.1 SPFH domain-containing protein [Nitrospinaceae bacterium]NIS83965.1 SPFH domain-containing protein [Nitrospinaceae bacterium]NIT80774.1 SPFH domain-containing protein [Nitrospinaceae bacterium]NIU43080.1 SPFH domain-containing protein [Nitrospinaceae bacterium]